jgi:hypothetical protein
MELQNDDDRHASNQQASTSARQYGVAPSFEEWQAQYAKAKARLEHLQEQNRHIPVPGVDILRSSQVDAARLDTELTLMLGEQFAAVFKFFNAGRVARFEPELNALLRGLIFSLSVWQGRATPGSELMNLRYRNERSAAAATGGKSGVQGPGLSQQQKVLFGLGFVALPYAWSRLQRYAVQQEWGERWGACKLELAGPGAVYGTCTTTPDAVLCWHTAQVLASQDTCAHEQASQPARLQAGKQASRQAGKAGCHLSSRTCQQCSLLSDTTAGTRHADGARLLPAGLQGGRRVGPAGLAPHALP